MISRPAGEMTTQQARSNAWLAWPGATNVLTGAQLIARSFPIMRDALGLSDPRVP